MIKEAGRFRCESFEEYLRVLQDQVALHGPEAVRAGDFMDYRYMDFRIGIRTPDGWWTVSLGTIRAHYATQDFEHRPAPGPDIIHLARVPTNDQLVRLVMAALKEAKTLGTQKHSSPPRSAH